MRETAEPAAHESKAFPAARLLLLWAAYVLAVEGASLLFDPAHPVNPDFIRTHHGFLGPPGTLPALCRWDCAWYVSIANQGYPGPLGTAAYSAAFFPLYGLAMRAVGHALHLGAASAGAWISRVALLASLGLLFDAARLFGFDEKRRWATVAALLAMPSSFMMLAGYADGLFLCLSLAAFVATLRGRPLTGSWFAFAAGLTRIHAVALVVGLGALGLREGSRAPRATPGQRLWSLAYLAPALTCAAAIFGLMLYLRVTTGDAFAFVHDQAWYGKAGGGLAASFYELGYIPLHYFPPTDLTKLHWLLLLVTAGVWWLVLGRLAATRSWTLLAYAGATYALCLASGTHRGGFRYFTMIFPVSLAVSELARRRRPWLAFLLGSAAAQLLFLMEFVTMRAPGP